MEHPYHILLVDDEPPILEAYQNFFRKRGFDVDAAHDGLEGLQKLRHGEYDVALVDIKMPKMDGIEMIRKATEEGIDTDMIVLTAHGEKKDAVAALNLGYGAVSGWFEKGDIDMAALLAKVKQVIHGVPLEEVRRILSAIPEQA